MLNKGYSEYHSYIFFSYIFAIRIELLYIRTNEVRENIIYSISCLSVKLDSLSCSFTSFLTTSCSFTLFHV